MTEGVALFINTGRSIKTRAKRLGTERTYAFDDHTLLVNGSHPLGFQVQYKKTRGTAVVVT